MQQKFNDFAKELNDLVNSERRALENIETIRGDVYSSEYAKTQKIDELQSESQKRRKAAYEKLSGILEDLKTAAEQREKDTSFIGDAYFVNVLQLLALLDNDARQNAMEGLVAKYKNSPLAIKALESYCHGQNIPVFDEDTAKYTADYVRAFARIDDQLYWALNLEQFGSIYNVANINFSVISDFAEVLGCTYEAPETVETFIAFKNA